MEVIEKEDGRQILSLTKKHQEELIQYPSEFPDDENTNDETAESSNLEDEISILPITADNEVKEEAESDEIAGPVREF